LARERSLVIDVCIGRQMAHQLRAQRTVVVANRNERALQQAGDRPGHCCCHLGAVRSAEAKRRVRQRNRVA
jgi:hypothetical protein